MTTDEIKDLAVTILREEDDFLVPAVKLVELILDEKESWNLGLEQLLEILSQDERFYILDSKSTQEPWSEDDDEIMEGLGFHKGPRVMLEERRPDKEEMQQAVQERMQQVTKCLKQAYGMGENMDDADETEFLQILSKAKDLQNKLDDDQQDDE